MDTSLVLNAAENDGSEQVIRPRCAAPQRVAALQCPCGPREIDMKVQRSDDPSKDLGGRRPVLAVLLAAALNSALGVAPPAHGKGGKYKKKKGRYYNGYACPLEEICQGKCKPGCRFDQGGCRDGRTCSRETKQCRQKCDGYPC